MEFQVGRVYTTTKDADGNYVFEEQSSDDECECTCCDHASKGAH